MKRGYNNNPPPILRSFTGFAPIKQFAFSKRSSAPTKSKKALTFRQFIQRANPQYRFYKHCEALIAVLQRVADGEIKRLMIFTPPRHGKSETISRLFTAYFLYRHPQYWIGLASYAADLAYTLSRNARENYLRAVGLVSEQASAVKQWETGLGGGLWAAGAGGPATGKGGHLLLVDDPIKNAEEAASETIRAKLQDWWNSTWYTREEPWSDSDPNGAMIVVQTRWHEDDLAGWLLQQERDAEDADELERWHIVNLPAIAEDLDAEQFPSTCTVEPDWRKTGEALCPERRPIEKLRRIANRIGDYFFEALFQQRPTAREGEFFKVSKFEIVEAAPAGLRLCRGWDLASVEGGGAYTSGVLIGTDSKGIWYVLDVVRNQWSSDDVEMQLLNTARTDGVNVRVHLPQDPGQAGKKQGLSLARMLAGFIVKVEPVSGSKEARAFAFSAQVNIGNVKILKGPWNKAFIEELRQFPRGKYMDQVDSSSDAFNELALGGQFSQGEFFR